MPKNIELVPTRMTDYKRDQAMDFDSGWIRKLRATPEKRLPQDELDKQAKKKFKRAYMHEVESIEREYTQRSEDLEVWKSDKLETCKERYRQNVQAFCVGGQRQLEEEEKEVNGNHSNSILHTYPPNQFQLKNGKSACTSISVVCSYNYLKKGTEPLKIKWSTIVSNGAKVWAAWKNQTRSYGNLQLVQEILELEGMEAAKETLEIVTEIGGSIDSNLVSNYKRDCVDVDKSVSNTLEDAIHSIQSYEARVTAIFSIRNASITIMHDPEVDERFWLFDSHGGDKANESSLFECPSAKALIKELRYKYPVRRACSVNWKHHDTRETENLFSIVVLRKKEKLKDSSA